VEGQERDYRLRFAHALTRASNAGDRIGVLTVWNGFSEAYSVSLLSLCRGFVERRYAYLDIELPEIQEERSDTIIILLIVE